MKYRAKQVVAFCIVFTGFALVFVPLHAVVIALLELILVVIAAAFLLGTDEESEYRYGNKKHIEGQSDLFS